MGIYNERHTLWNITLVPSDIIRFQLLVDFLDRVRILLCIPEILRLDRPYLRA